MFRNRFELFYLNNLLIFILSIINMSIAYNDRLKKILPFSDKLQRKYQEILTTGKHIAMKR